MNTYVEKNCHGWTIDIIMSKKTLDQMNQDYEPGGEFWELVPEEEVHMYFCPACGGTLLSANGTCCC